MHTLDTDLMLNVIILTWKQLSSYFVHSVPYNSNIHRILRKVRLSTLCIMYSVANPERVIGWLGRGGGGGGRRNYLIFMGKFRKSWANWSNRPPLSKFEPRIQQSLTVYPTILDRLDSLVVECPLRVREVAGSIPSLSYQRREKWYQYLPCLALSIKKVWGGGDSLLCGDGYHREWGVESD